MRLNGRATEIAGAAMRRARTEDGFTMIFALLTLLISGLLVAAAFSAASGDIRVTERGTSQAKAYYAAMAGINRYQYQLTTTPESWTKCPTIGTSTSPTKVTGTTDESYYVKTLGSTGHTCESGKQSTILETSGAAKGTFRILSVGTVKEGTKTITRKIVATFAHPGFTKYVYESNYEVEDPVNFGQTPATCEHYYAYRKANNLTTTCPPIEFAPEDEVNGPLHTNDAAEICSSGGQEPTFGREGFEDEISMNGGYYAASGCGDTPKINGKYATGGASLLPPETDVELLEAAGKKYDGRTEIELKTGSPNTMKVTNKEITETIPFPSNGVIYVENSKTESCAITNYTPFDSNTVADTGCGNVYIHGEYTESLTIASADDVIVNGNLTTTHEEDGEPTGAATLGLIAENFVRVYHPVKRGYTTTNATPKVEPAENGKCVKATEVSGNILRSTEVKGVTTSGLSNGDEVAASSTIETGTTIKVEGSEKLKLSKAAKPPAKEFTVKTAPKSTEVSEINTAGLLVGDEVEGVTAGQIESNATITELKASEKKVKLSSAVKPKELTAMLLRNEVTHITTTELATGNEIEGTVAGEITAGTTITVEAGEKLKLSKAAKLTATEATGTTNTGSLEVTGITTTGLTVGEELEGTKTGQFKAGTTITAINATKKTITLSAKPEKSESIKIKFYGESTKVKVYLSTAKLKIYGETSTLKIYHVTGYAYNTALGNCHEVKTTFDEFRESENLYIKYCEANTTYTSEGFCEYENTKNGCSSKATNMNATEDPNHWGSFENLVVDAAILSTNHSWIVDNYKCGKKLGTLTVWGSIAQFWRGPVGTQGNPGTGYIKSYNYDERLAAQEPPSFLSPTNASSWKVTRETAPPTTFTG
jgi:Tfp pilus assembly protein PilX